MGWRRIAQGIETQTLEIQPTACPVCRKSLYRNVTFLTGGWARCSQCNEVVHYACLSGGKFLKDRPRFCADCKAGRVRPFQKMPVPPPKPPTPEPVMAAAPAAPAPPAPPASAPPAPAAAAPPVSTPPAAVPPPSTTPPAAPSA